MKKIYSILLSVILAAFVTGCGAGSSAAPAGVDKEPSKETVKTEASVSAEASVSSETSTIIEEETPAAPSFTRYDEGFVYTPEGFYLDTSTELKNVVMGIFPLSDTASVFQFSTYDATMDEETPAEYDYVFTFTTEDGKTYTHTEEDQQGEKINISVEFTDNGTPVVKSDFAFSSDFTGSYSPIEGGVDPTPWAIVEYLRYVPGVDLGDFGLNNPYDDIVDSSEAAWLYDITLLREGEYYDRFWVTGDFSAVFEQDEETFKLVAGSVENLLDYTMTYELYDEEEDTYNVYEDKLVGACVLAGSSLIVGQDSEVLIYAPVDLTESISVSSSDTGIVSVNGANITAVAPGEATLTVDYVYGGFKRTQELPVSVLEDNPEIDDTVTEYVDEKYTTYFDKVSQRAVLELCHEDDTWSAEVLWADDAETMHHWSYIGTDDGKGNLTLNGSYYIEKIGAEYTEDQVVFENMGATLTLGDDGCYYWHDDYADAGKDCIFELPEY